LKLTAAAFEQVDVPALQTLYESVAGPWRSWVSKKRPSFLVVWSNVLLR
jgi:hypothetical protein